MQKITPFLWFDNQAAEAANFYVGAFSDSSIGNVSRYDKAAADASGNKEGTVMTVDFKIAGLEIGALNGGPLYKFTPAVSFFVNCETDEEIEALWKKLSEGGEIRMAFKKYPFSEKYGGCDDKYGVSWQLNLVGKTKQKIVPSLLFVGNQYGKTADATKLYMSLFENSSMEVSVPYEQGEDGGNKTTALKYSKFNLDGMDFIAMDSGHKHEFTFSGAISFLISCDTQTEIDKFWDAFSTGGEVQQCGWVKDKYGVTWQVAPTILNKLLTDPDQEKAQNVMQAMLSMVKLDIAGLQAAYDKA